MRRVESRCFLLFDYLRTSLFMYDSFVGMAKIALIIALLVLYGCDNPPADKPPSLSGGKNQSEIASNVKPHGVTSLSLSPDNRSILFALCDEPGDFDIASYEIATKKLTRINPTGQTCLAPIYSSDGKMLTFASGKGDDKNIFVMSADGSNLRQLTHTVNDKTLRENTDSVVRINGGPSFSPDRTKIIFGRSGVRRQRSMGGEMVSHWDIYEVEVASGRERRLTNLSFYRTTRPFYLPDGQGFIFSGSGPKGADLPTDMQPKNGNDIMIMDKTRPYPHLAFEHETYAVEPTISLDGTIVFISKINEFDGLKGQYFYDLFIRKEERTKRLTMERFAIIEEAFLSFDGTLVVFFAHKTRNEGPSLWLIKSDGTELTCIGRPWNQENLKK
jgi:Tol biopolymer transport system component